MFGKSASSLAAAFLFSSTFYLAVHAEVVPSTPGPGDVFRVGQTCRVTWAGDKNSTTAWKDMAIQLMTGSNTEMVHLTTVATEQDGTVDGSFEYTCPDVTPNSAIYFYQFTSPHITADSKQWTTRFTIASASGETTPESESTQPDGASIPWGTGALVDAASAVPPPDFDAAANSSGSVPATSAVTTAASSSSVTSFATSPSPSSSGLTTVRGTATAETETTEPTGTSGSSSNTNTTDNSDQDGALSLAPTMTRAVGVLAAGAAVFTFLL